MGACAPWAFGPSGVRGFWLGGVCKGGPLGAGGGALGEDTLLVLTQFLVFEFSLKTCGLDPRGRTTPSDQESQIRHLSSENLSSMPCLAVQESFVLTRTHVQFRASGSAARAVRFDLSSQI